MGDLTDHIAEEFTTSELVIIAEKVGLAPTSRWGNRRLIDSIRARIDKEGIPEPPQTDDEEYMSRSEILLEEFLYVAQYTDADGDIIEQKGDDNVETLENFMIKHNVKELPDCFTFADDGDPACKRCIVYKFCAEERIANLPPCFGILWDKNAPECKICLEQPFCKDAVLAH